MCCFTFVKSNSTEGKKKEDKETHSLFIQYAETTLTDS